MSKYTLLIILNVPFVLLGIIKALNSFKKGAVGPFDLTLRVGFWVIILVGLFFAENIYNYLVVQGLTDSTPLSIADVVLVTGINFCLFLILRLYTKIELQERRFMELHEKLSIELSASKRHGSRK
jgi:hypothetical protein